MRLEDYLTSKKADEAFRQEVQDLPDDVKRELGTVAARMSPSLSILKEILLLSKQTALRDKVSQSEILRVCDTKKEVPKAERLKSYRAELRRLRYPERAKLEAEINSEVDKIKSECSLGLKLPQELEGDTFKVELKFRDEEALEKQIQRLTKLKSSDAFKKVRALLLGTKI